MRVVEWIKQWTAKHYVNQRHHYFLLMLVSTWSHTVYVLGSSQSDITLNIQTLTLVKVSQGHEDDAIKEMVLYSTISQRGWWILEITFFKNIDIISYVPRRYLIFFPSLWVGKEVSHTLVLKTTLWDKFYLHRWENRAAEEPKFCTLNYKMLYHKDLITMLCNSQWTMSNVAIPITTNTLFF